MDSAPWKGQGYAIRDYFEGDTSACIYVHGGEEDKEKVEAAIFFRDFALMPTIEKAALDLCYGAVLDIGAGAGCHSIELQNRGLAVTAVDISPESVDVMIRRGIRDARLINFIFLKDEKYDTLLLMMNGIGITGSIQGLRLFLTQASELLNPGGQIVFDSLDLRDKGERIKSSELKIDKNLNSDHPDERYFGEVEYRIEYKGIIYPPFNWVFVDTDTMMEISKSTSWFYETILKNDDGRFLGRLSR